MRKYLGLLAVALALASARPASAWCDGSFGFGFSISCGGCGPSCGYGCGGPSCGYGSCGFGFGLGCGFGCGPSCGPSCSPSCGPCIGPWNPPCGYAPALSPCCVQPYYPPTCCPPPCAPTCGYGGYSGRYAPPPPNPYVQGAAVDRSGVPVLRLRGAESVGADAATLGLADDAGQLHPRLNCSPPIDSACRAGRTTRLSRIRRRLEKSAVGFGTFRRQELPAARTRIHGPGLAP